ncbi:hypothetical protein HXY33_07075 [Candidatus Bathyarchaeota archaeon]|nr:hypothetical protein [Candidatus Bathyarchaeota archaeon]
MDSLLEMDWTHYHNYTEITTALFTLNDTYPNLVDVFSIGKSAQNADIYCVRLTNEIDTRPKPKVLFVGYHHAREPITAELTLYFVTETAMNYGVNQSITRMLNSTEVYTIVALNVDAFEVVTQNEWQRKNIHPVDEDYDGLLDEDAPDDEDGDGYIEQLLRLDEYGRWVFDQWEGLDDDSDGLLNEDWVGGVDLNRNYGYQWNATCYSGSPDPNDEDYRGAEPFSEAETQVFRDFTLQHNFSYAISFHSGAEVILYPWGHKTTETPDDVAFKAIAGNLSALVNATYEQSGHFYTTSGSWDDWMYGNRSIMALTCEIYMNESAWKYQNGPEPNTMWKGGVYEYFNPDPSNILSAILRWLPALTYTIERTISENQVHDLKIESICPLKATTGTSVGEGYTMGIKLSVTNEGEADEILNASVYANNQLVETKEFTVFSTKTSNVTFTWNTTNWIYGNYSLSAYLEPVWWEEDQSDNFLAEGSVLLSLPGDLTCDKFVNAKDAVPTGAAFGSTPSRPAWNANADINDDKIVNGKDALILGNHFGRRLETTLMYIGGLNDNESIYESAYYGSDGWRGIMYTPASSYYIRRVELIIGQGTGNFTIQVRPDYNGWPSETVLGEVIFEMSSGLSWQGVNFPDSYYLVGGATYWIVFKPVRFSRCSFAEGGVIITSVYDYGEPGWDSKTASYAWMVRFYGDVTTEVPAT